MENSLVPLKSSSHRKWHSHSALFFAIMTFFYFLKEWLDTPSTLASILILFTLYLLWLGVQILLLRWIFKRWKPSAKPLAAPLLIVSSAVGLLGASLSTWLPFQWEGFGFACKIITFLFLLHSEKILLPRWEKGAWAMALLVVLLYPKTTAPLSGWRNASTPQSVSAFVESIEPRLDSDKSAE